MRRKEVYMNQFSVSLWRIACVFFAVLVCMSITSEKTQAGNRLDTYRTNNAVIKSMPIMQRPNRIGHFYGNSVRRVYYRTNGRVNIEQRRPKLLIGDL